jgi:hypothetical protein
MARRKNPPSDTTLYIALAAAGAALYFLLSPKAAAKTPTIGDNPFGPPGGGPPDGALPDGFMSDDRAKQLQKNLNAWSFGQPPAARLVEDGDFGPMSWAFYQDARRWWAKAGEYAKAQNLSNLNFFADPNIFYDPVDSDKISFRLKGSSDTVTLRKSLYEKLSAQQVKPVGTNYTENDAVAWKESPSPPPLPTP